MNTGPQQPFFNSRDYLGIRSNKPIRGLGDLIARVTDSLHIPKCSSCTERQKMLNDAFPFGKGVTGGLDQ